MKNKTLILIILFLLPIAVISFISDETNFSLQKKEAVEINVKLKMDDDTIVNIPLEEYVLGVVAAEMPATFHEEAIKAQAVATRTYTMSKLNENRLYDVTGADQAYITKAEMALKWGEEYQIYYDKLFQVVAKTINEVMTYDNKIITAFYFAMSNGYTEDCELVFKASEPYLQSVESKWEDDTINKFSVTNHYPKKEFCSKLKIQCNDVVITNIEKSLSNRVNKLSINSKVFTGIQIRNLLSLRSTDFTIIINQNTVEVTTKGYGHGVGLSQYGANGMAKDNYKYQDILKYYYQGIEIITI